MTQTERRLFLLRALLAERPDACQITVPANAREQQDLLRALVNVRPPAPVSDAFLQVEQAYRQAETAAKGIVRPADLTPVQPDLYLWQGDITTLACDAIVNAANSQMLGCFRPLHTCIDNCIHTCAGVQLRNYCHEIMKKQGHEEPPGQAKITPAFNLPCRYVLHTVGPIVNGKLTQKHCALLASCYTSCLKLAEENGCQSVAFCCIATGVFGFPRREAAQIAVQTVKEYKRQTGSSIKIIFNVFKNEDLAIYRELLARPAEQDQRSIPHGIE